MKSPELLRNTVIEKLTKIFESNPLPERVFYDNAQHDWSDDILHNIIKNLEISIYNSCIKVSLLNDIPRCWNFEIDNRPFNQFRDLYKNKAISIINNLDPNGFIKNKNLLNRFLFNEKNNILDSKFDEIVDISEKIHYLCNIMKPMEMFPERYDSFLKDREELFNKMKHVEEIEDGLLQCGRCKSRKVKYHEMQTRSADEPATLFCHCTKCNNRWRMG